MSIYLESKLSNFISLVKPAKDLATKAHEGTYRRGKKKGKKIEYITHPEAVARLVQKMKKSKYIGALISAAYLHDTIEDTDVTSDIIRKIYGKEIIDKISVDDVDTENIIELVVSLVEELTSDPKEIEKLGKESYLTKKMLHLSSWALVIKLCDRLHNLYDINEKISGSPSDVRWAIKYSTQTQNIINTLEKKRELSGTQKKVICLIKDKIAPALNIDICSI